MFDCTKNLYFKTNTISIKSWYATMVVVWGGGGGGDGSIDEWGKERGGGGSRVRGEGGDVGRCSHNVGGGHGEVEKGHRFAPQNNFHFNKA